MDTWSEVIIYLGAVMGAVIYMSVSVDVDIYGDIVMGTMVDIGAWCGGDI